MIVEPRIRGFICTTAHPTGCAQHVQEQIDFIRAKGEYTNGPKKALIIGASTGYGLSSRIACGFGCGAGTIGVFFEKEPDGKKTATAGYYNSVAYEQKAHEAGLYAKSINGDAFSDDIKSKTAALIKKDLGQVDMVIYSLASPRRVHPKTGEAARSVLKPIGKEYTNQSINMNTHQLEEVTLPTATQEEIDQTICVMGGEDWQMWMDALSEAGVLTDDVVTVAYSYIGPELTRGVYRNGTIGAAKDHLEKTSKALDKRLKEKGGRAYISVNKALVTQSSSAIPFIPLYFVLLSKVMKEKNCDEDCVAQIDRMFRERLLTDGEVPVDESGFIRLDDHEMREDIQEIVDTNWNKLTQENLEGLSNLKGYDQDFLKLFGFGLAGVDYSADVDTAVFLPSKNQ